LISQSLLIEVNRSNVRAAEMGLQDGRGLFEVGQHPRSVDSVLLRFALERLGLRWFQREAPMKINAPEGRCLVQEVEPVGCEDFGDRICILRLARKIEAGQDARVLRETRAFRQSAYDLSIERIRESSSRSVRPRSSMTVRENKHP
jgi:hypothetical protein